MQARQFLCGGISHIATIVAILGIKSGFEGEDTEHLVAQAGYLMHAPAFPCPHFRRDIVDDLGLGQVLLAESCHAQVEGWIVNQDQYVRFFVQQRLFGDAEIILHVAPMTDHRGKTHECHVPYMAVKPTPGGFHSVASETCYLCFRVMQLDLFDQFSCV